MTHTKTAPTNNHRQSPIAISSQQTPQFIIALITLAGTQVLLIFSLIILLFTNGSLARKERVYIQTQTGSEEAVQVDPLYRDPDLIKSTVQSFTQYMFEWTGRLPDGTEDEGIDAYGVTIPSKVYVGSFLIDPGLRPPLIKAMAGLIPEQVLNGTFESTIIIHEVSEPVQIAPGEWSVRMVAARIERNSGSELAEVVFSRRIDLKAIRPQTSAFVEAEQSSAFNESIRLLLRNGLIITNMVEG